MDRRTFLSTATLPLIAPLLGAHPAAGSGRSSLIVLWMDGGMTHLDTFDGKPESRPDIRGDLKCTRVKGNRDLFVSEHLPRIAKVLPHASVIRSLSSGEGNHDRGSAYMLTGHRPSPVLRYPSLAAASARDAGPLPAFVAVPDAHPYAGSGYLGATRGPFEVGGDPSRPGWGIPDLAPRPGIARALDLARAIDRGDPEATTLEVRAKALALSRDPEARAAFDLRREKPETRQRYGRNRLGQSCLLARRLAERGVSCVFVRDTGWDHHRGIARALTYGFPPKLDALDGAVAALFKDLRDRDLLERVTVVLASEFGRTPRLNPAGGRDHWPRAHSSVLFGAGLKAGVVVGKTDVRGEEPVERPVSPGDFVATVAAAVGLRGDTTLHTPTGRPVPLTEQGSSPVSEVLT